MERSFFVFRHQRREMQSRKEEAPKLVPMAMASFWAFDLSGCIESDSAELKSAKLCNIG